VERFGEQLFLARSPFSPSNNLQIPQTTHPNIPAFNIVYFSMNNYSIRFDYRK